MSEQAAKKKTKEKFKKPKVSESLVEVEVDVGDKFNYDIIVPTKNKKEKQLESKKKRENEKTSTKKRLTRKQKKLLEKVIERKDKSSKRKEILEKLSAYQLKTNELELYDCVRDIGNKKRAIEKSFELESLAQNQKASVVVQRPTSSIKGKRSAQLVSVNGKQKNKKAKTETAVFTESSEIDTDDMSTDDEDEKVEETEKNEKSKVIEPSEQEKEKQQRLHEMRRPQDDESDNDEQLKEKSSDSANVIKRPTRYVHVNRREDIQEARLKLPIINEEHSIMETISDNDIVIICGETGSGKTTQVPQFLYEAGYAENGQMIGITEPRRVAAISMAKRVGDEMNMTESQCSYQIRYEGTHSPDTKIKFMTDGVLMKELQMDFLLSRYSALIIDEAHERTVSTDILIGLLSRIVPLRNKRGDPLKLIIMSATLRVEDFTSNEQLFKKTPKIIKIESRQFPVSIHFNKHTYDDYMAEAFRKVTKIHRRLPDGGILVFVTGQQEVNVLCAKLRKAFPFKFSSHAANQPTQNQTENDNTEKDTSTTATATTATLTTSPSTVKSFSHINLDSYSKMPLDDEIDAKSIDNDEDISDKSDHSDNSESDTELDSDFDISNHEKEQMNSSETVVRNENKPLFVLPLYALLSNEEQAKIFQKVPNNCRACIVATNIAETSLTIPNIKYVIDTGKVKSKLYDPITGVTKFHIDWTSKASADQRSGRAGRTSPGHCYRLYSSAVYNDRFPMFSEPEIAKKPVEDLVLQMKDIGIDRIHNFPFPTPPDKSSLKIAENLLIKLGALELDRSRIKNTRDEQVSKITELGKLMACFPVNPRYAKMLALALKQETMNKNKLISYIVCLICGLSVNELFLDGETTIANKMQSKTSKTQDKSKENETNETSKHVVRFSDIRKSWLNAYPGSNIRLLGDLMLYLIALGAIEHEEIATSQTLSADKSSSENNMFAKFCQQYGLRYKAVIEAKKLRNQLTNTINLMTPDLENLTIGGKIPPPTDEEAKCLRQIILSGNVDKLARKFDEVVKDKNGNELKNAYQSLTLEDPIFIHPSSVLFRDLPTYVCYSELSETSKMYMKSLCAIEPTWLPVYLSNLCSFDLPVMTPIDADTDDASDKEQAKAKQMQPRYDPERGIVVCHRSSTFGSVMWKIAPIEVEFPPSLDLYKLFAKFFLEGKVVDGLRYFTSSLLISPGILLKPWAKIQPRTESIINALVDKKCYSKKRLLELVSANKNYLLNEYMMWLPESMHLELRLKWPNVFAQTS